MGDEKEQSMTALFLFKKQVCVAVVTKYNKKIDINYFEGNAEL